MKALSKPAIDDGQELGAGFPPATRLTKTIGDKSMKIPHAPSFRRTRLASACGLLLAGVTVAHAQGAAAAAGPAASASAADRSDVQSVTVTGIRASLDSSMALKRDAHGIVDGITAEDVGKFPDTN